MQVELFLRNKINRQIKWNGQTFVFIKYKEDNYHQLTDEFESEIEIQGLFHEGGGYGGMLNIELYERDGSKSISKMKPMILCLYDDYSKNIQMEHRVVIGDNLYRVVAKNDIKNMHIAYEISLESVDEGL